MAAAYSTFHAKVPLLRWPLDHVFCSSDFTLVSLARLPDVGADHFPIHVVLCHRPGATAWHEEPTADGDDHAEAEAKIATADERRSDDTAFANVMT